jgi:hypothetical protein
MKRHRKISRGSLHAIATLDALAAYRAAFKAGRLGWAHGDVVRAAYALAADEVLHRGRVALRMAAGWFLLGLAFTATMYGLGFNIDVWWIANIRSVFLALAALAFGRELAYSATARLLTPPPIVELDDESS